MQSLLEIVQAPISGYVLALILGAIALSGKLSIGAADVLLLIAFALASIEVIHARPDWRLGGACISAIASACLLIGWWVSPSSAMHEQQPVTPSNTAIKPRNEKHYFPQPLTMRNLFDTDFPQYLSVGSDLTVAHADQTHKHVISMRLFVNFDDRSEFVTFFIPRQIEKDQTFQLCAAAIINHKAAIESVKKNVQVIGMVPGDTAPTASQNLNFTGRIFVYYEDHLSLAELASLEQLANQNGVAPQFRGHTYLTLHWNEQREIRPTATATATKP